MKKISFLMIALAISMSVAAQDDSYKGAAKMEVKTFWRQAEMFKNGKGSESTINNMQKALAGVKEKDPSYNTSVMEEELKKWKAGVEDKVAASKTPEQKEMEEKLSTITYSGPAKNNVISFWQNGFLHEDKLGENELNVAIGNMKNSLARTKEKDPSYSTKEMEATLEKFQNARKQIEVEKANKYTGDKTKSVKEQPISNDAGKLFEDLFENENLQAGAGTVTGEKLKSRMEAFNQKADKLLSMDYADAKIKHTRMSKGVINGMKMKTERELKDVDVMLGEFRDQDAMEIGYYTIQFHLAYWDAAKKVFSEESSYQEMYNKVKASADKMGSLESMKGKADANNTEYIKNTKLPAPVVKDAKLEKVLMDGFNKKFGAQNNVSALKVVLTQDGWTTLRNPITSIITGRERSAKIAYKGGDGKCYMIIDYVFIHEEYIGGSFTNTKAVFNGLDGKEMLCENVK